MMAVFGKLEFKYCLGFSAWDFGFEKNESLYLLLATCF